MPELSNSNETNEPIVATASAGNGDGSQHTGTRKQVSMKDLLASRIPFDVWPDDVFASEPAPEDALGVSSRDVKASFAGDWEIIPGVRLNKIGLDYRDGETKDFTLTSVLCFFKGTSDEIILDLLAEYQKEEDTATLIFVASTDPKTKIHLGSLVDELLKETGLGLQLPDALHNLEVGNLDVELTIAQQEIEDEVTDEQGQTTIESSLQTSRLLSIGFTLGSSAGDWELIPGFLSLEPARIDLILGNGAVQVEISDSVSLLGVNWLMDVQLPSLRGSLEMAGGKGKDDGYSIAALLDHFHLPAGGLESAKLSGAGVFFDARARVAMLHLELKDLWRIGGFEIKDVQFELDYQGGQGGGFGAQFSAAIEIKPDKTPPIDVLLSASHMGPGLGWQVEGSTGRGQEIPIVGLLIDLGKKFGISSDCPASVASLVFKNLDICFNTATKDFTFKGEADFKVGDTDVSIEVSIDITHQSDPTQQGEKTETPDKTDDKIKSVGLAQKRFSGVIKFGANEFDVVFDDRKENAVEIGTLVAAYQSTGGGFSINGLVPARYANDLPDIKTKGAFLAKQWKKPGDNNEATTSKWLLGLSLEAGLDLSNVKLPDLPLMGSGGPPKSLKLDLQVLVATAKFTESDVGIIGALNATGGVSVPSHEVESVAVATVLLMDGKTVTLNLPIKANPGAHTKNGGAPFGDVATVNNKDAQPARVAVADPAVAVTPDDTKWINIQKNFGPIHVERVGLKYEKGNLFILLDGGLTVAGFTVSLEGLGVDTPLTKFDPHFHLSGIGLDYKSGGVELGGAFLMQQRHDPVTNTDYPAYAGEAVLKTAKLSLSAIGSFFKLPGGETSLFVYAVLDYPLGGPPFFFVTGLAAGFGYNRRAIVPEVEQIHTYPLVTKAIAGPPAKGAAKTDLAAELAALDAFVPAELGEIFLAVGVKFTSFKLIESFALIIAQFGTHNQFDLVGVSHLQIPSKEAAGATGSLLADITMNWKAVFKPAEGMVGLKADIVPGSYVFSPDCHLTGGFAYYAWLGGEHAGDFVYTLGGYHPDFRKPDHYPTVSRLGFNWILKEANLNIKGELYYALTGHAFMAGGRLDASMHGGFDIGIGGVDFAAALHIAADFLISWEPYHYDAAVSLDLKIDISVHLFGFSKSLNLDVGGDMHIWGPEFAGEAHLYLKVWEISHTLEVKFGGGPAQLRPITWDRFGTAFLPRTDKIPDEYELELIRVEKAENSSPQRKSRVIVAKVNVNEKDLLHFQIFDADGKKVMDKRQDELLDRDAELAALQKVLEGLWDNANPEKSKKDEIVKSVASILRYSGPDPHAICGASVKGGLIRSSGDRWVVNAKEFSMVTDSVIPIKAAKRGNVSLVVSNQFSDRPEKGEAKKYDDVTIDFGIAPMGVKPGELTTVHKIEITRDGKSAEVFFRCEPVFKKVPAAMWDKPVFVKGSNDQFLEKPEINPERQLVPGVLGGLEVLPADPPHCGDTLPVDRRELRYDTKLIGDAFQWEEIPAFKAAVFEEGEAEKGKAAKKRLKDTILITADEGDAWKARKDIRDELGLGREEIYFGQPADQYMIDAPQIEKAEEFHDV